MANYSGYFRADLTAKDSAAFIKDMGDVQFENELEIVETPDGGVTVIATDPTPSMCDEPIEGINCDAENPQPPNLSEEDAESWEEGPYWFSMSALIQKHIEPGTHAVMIEIGNEALRHLAGIRCDITEDDVVWTDLNIPTEQLDKLPEVDSDEEEDFTRGRCPCYQTTGKGRLGIEAASGYIPRIVCEDCGDSWTSTLALALDQQTARRQKKRKNFSG